MTKMELMERRQQLNALDERAWFRLSDLGQRAVREWNTARLESINYALTGSKEKTEQLPEAVREAVNDPILPGGIAIITRRVFAEATAPYEALSEVAYFGEEIEAPEPLYGKSF